jgi:hypothetical protein
MPEVSLSYGIRITMYYEDHTPPHFRAEYNGSKVLIDIQNATVSKRIFPLKQLKLVLAWCEIHKEELMENWKSAEEYGKINRIEPLR